MDGAKIQFLSREPGWCQLPGQPTKILHPCSTLYTAVDKTILTQGPTLFCSWAFDSIISRPVDQNRWKFAHLQLCDQWADEDCVSRQKKSRTTERADRELRSLFLKVEKQTAWSLRLLTRALHKSRGYFILFVLLPLTSSKQHEARLRESLNAFHKKGLGLSQLLRRCGGNICKVTPVFRLGPRRRCAGAIIKIRRPQPHTPPRRIHSDPFLSLCVRTERINYKAVTTRHEAQRGPRGSGLCSLARSYSAQGTQRLSAQVKPNKYSRRHLKYWAQGEELRGEFFCVCMLVFSGSNWSLFEPKKIRIFGFFARKQFALVSRCPFVYPSSETHLQTVTLRIILSFSQDERLLAWAADTSSLKETSTEGKKKNKKDRQIYKRDTNLDFLWQWQAAAGEKGKKERKRKPLLKVIKGEKEKHFAVFILPPFSVQTVRVGFITVMAAVKLSALNARWLRIHASVSLLSGDNTRHSQRIMSAY